MFDILKRKKAFTIAEMTVVLLILSIVMAAILPVTTNKRTSGSGGSSGLWKLARNNTDIWFASPSSTQSVLMGTSQTPDANGYGRLYINIPNSNSRSQIAMMYNNSTEGYIKFKNKGNIGLGANPLPSAISGSHNISIGQDSLQSATSAGHSIALGNGALQSATSGGHNIALGYQTLGKTTEGTTNIALGQSTLYNNTTGNYNIGLGHNSLITNSAGSDNVGIGREALAKTTSSNNTTLGYRSFYNNTSGATNTGLGYLAGNGNTEGSYNISIGSEAYAGGTKTGNNNIAIGNRAIYNANVSGASNIGIGQQSLYSLTKGSMNTIVGRQAAYNLTEGTANTGFGYLSLYGVTTGSTNSALGNYACGSVTTGSNKTCIGTYSGYSLANKGTLPNGFSTTNDTTQVLVGSGFGNIYLNAPVVQVRSGTDDGANSTFNVYGSTSTTTTLNVGTDATITQSASIGTYETVGTYLTVGTYATIPSVYVQNVKSSAGATASTSSTSIYGTLYGNWVPNSDKRLKNIEGFANTGLEEMKNLKVYKYHYKDNPDKQKIGLIAQDVEKVIPFAVQKGEDGYLGIVQDNIIYTMFNAIKDLDKLYESLKSKFQDYVVRLTFAENKINALIEVNKELSKRIDILEKRVNTLEKDFEKLEKRQCK